MKSVPAVAATARACQIHRGSWPREIRAIAHLPQLARDDLAVPDHEARDRGERLRNVQAVERQEQVADVGRRDQQAGCRDAQRALDQDVPRAPEAGNRQRHPEHLGVRARADDREEHRERDEGQLDRQALAEDREGDPGDRCQHDEDRGVHAEGPERFARRRDDHEDERERRDELALGRERVDRRLALDEQGTVLSCAHRQPDAVRVDIRSVRDALRRRATNQRPPNNTPAIRSVITTPAMPERPLLTFSFFTFLTAYPASGPSATALAFALPSKPLSMATLLSPSGAVLANGLANAARSERDEERAAANSDHSGATLHRHRPPGARGQAGAEFQLRLEIGRAVHDVGSHCEHHGNRGGGDDALTDTDEHVDTHHRAEHGRH